MRKGWLAVLGVPALLGAAVWWGPSLLMARMQAEDMARWPAAPAIAAPPAAMQETMLLTSPDGRIELSVGGDAQGPLYAVRLDGQEILGPARLGLVVDSVRLPASSMPTAVQRRGQDETWEQPWGEERFIRDRFQEMRLTYPGIDIVFRAYDDGIALRYERVGEAAWTVTDELTEFAPPQSLTAWWVPAWGIARDEYIIRRTPLSDLPAQPQARAVHTPLTLSRGEGTALSIHEAGLRHFAGMVLASQPGGRLRAQLVPRADGVAVRGAGLLRTPWRLVQIGRRPVDLANSRLLLNLNDPPAIPAESYGRPMKYVGVWWGFITHVWDRVPGANYGASDRRVRDYIDFAAENGFGGVLVESWNRGWESWPSPDGTPFSFTQPYDGFDLKGLAAYAKSRGVALIGHHETSGDLIHYEAKMQAGLDLYARIGVPAVKTGYVARQPGLRVRQPDGGEAREWQYSQPMVEHEERLARLAAINHIAIVAHEAVKDTGLRRTFPNLMARESARGQEYNGMDAVHGGNPPDHEPTLFFTRMLAGPMDFTPGILDVDFSDLPGWRGVLHRSLLRTRVNTTLAKQLALYVVFYSPVQMAADFIENYRARPDALSFIRQVPVDWARSIALQGDVGRFALVARQDRHSDDWYLGAITDGEGRRLEQLLDFLEPGRTYAATIWADAPDADWRRNPEAFVLRRQTVRAGDRLILDLAPGGGQAVWLRALPKADEPAP